MLKVALNRLFFRSKLCAKSVLLSLPVSVTQKPLMATGVGMEPRTRKESWAVCPRLLGPQALHVTAAKRKNSTLQSAPMAQRSLRAGHHTWSVMGQDSQQNPQYPAQVQPQVQS